MMVGETDIAAGRLDCGVEIRRLGYLQVEPRRFGLGDQGIALEQAQATGPVTGQRQLGAQRRRPGESDDCPVRVMSAQQPTDVPAVPGFGWPSKALVDDDGFDRALWTLVWLRRKG
jgi:hypothetical protein